MQFNHIFKEELNIINKSIKDIVNDINYKNEDDAILCESIINSLESYAAKKLKEGKCVQLPYLGTLRKHEVKSRFNEQSIELKGLRKSVTSEEYKKIIKDKAKSIILELQEENKNKRIFNEIKRVYKNKYEDYCKTIGQAYADMWIYSKTLFEPIEFNEEVQRQFDEISKNEK